MKHKIVLIGPGRLGQAVIRLLHEAGHEICAVIGREENRARAAARFAGCRGEIGSIDFSQTRLGDVVLLAVPDDLIEPTARMLRHEGLVRPDAILIHFSGLHTAAVMASSEAEKAYCLSLHPLQTFADAVIGVQNLPGTPFAVEGPESLLPLAEQLVADMGGTSFRLASEAKVLYHAAACVASNYLISLIGVSCQIMQACGLEQTEAFRLLLPLLRGTAMNLSALGPELALTGPISRGDAGTVNAHLQSMTGLDNDTQELYRVLGRKTVELALAGQRITPQQAEKVLAALKLEEGP